MSLADHLLGNKRRVDARRIVTLLWLSGIAFLAAYLSLVLLSRLGLPVEMVIAIIGVGMALITLVGGLYGRTMNSRTFFFTHKSAGIAPSGISACTDWLSGGFLLLILVATGTDRLILAPSVMIGMLLCTILFATAFQRSKVSTVPGFMTMRYDKRSVGLVALIFVAIVLGLLLVTEVKLASHLVTKLMVVEPFTALLMVIILIVLPTLIGGWMALVIMNAILVVWILICVLLPATVTGFFSNFLISIISYQSPTNLTDVLEFSELAGFNGFNLQSETIFQTAITTLVLSCGFACLPHALSRLTLSFHHVTVLESIGWSALSGFLVLSAFPLSIGLLAVEASTGQLSQALSQQPILQMLPALAILLAALNAASVTVFALSSAIIRLLRRTRNLDPGERTMFATRALSVILCGGLVFMFQMFSPQIGLTFLAAICISASALFAPLTAAIWASRISPWAVAAAMFVGGGMTSVFIAAPFVSTLFPQASYYAGQIPVLAPTSASGLGMLAGIVILIIGRGFALLSKSHTDEKLDDLRLLNREA